MKLFSKRFIPVFLLASVCFAQVSFENSGQTFGGGTINELKFADVNGDGSPDAFVVKGEWDISQPNSVWINNGKGFFTLSNQNVGSDGFGVVLGDLDADGDIDAFIAKGGYYSTKPSEIWLNDGNGNFTNSGQQLVNKNCGSIALADFDGDNDLDVFLGIGATESEIGPANQVWLNDGTGTFTNSGQLLGNGDHYSTHAGDIDNDGDIDVLVTCNTRENNENEIWSNDGTSTFTKKVLSKHYSKDLALGDLDNDGDLDVVITYFGRDTSDTVGAEIFLNDGSGNFTSGSQKFDSVQCIGVALGDLNNDGSLDILFGNGDWNIDYPNTVWLNNGNGNFVKAHVNFGNADGTLVELADVDDDGDLDVVSGNKIWFNTTSLETVTDMDGNVYHTVTIGTQVWMKENLKTTHYRNGDTIPNVISTVAWGGLTTGAYCNYNNDTTNGAMYGRLYNWYAVTDSRNICPDGWHVPSFSEWQILSDFLGGIDVAGGKMKDTVLWNSPNTGADNSSGFSGLPGGTRFDAGSFYNLGFRADFWSSTPVGGQAYQRDLQYDNAKFSWGGGAKMMGFSVRCLRDLPVTIPDPPETFSPHSPQNEGRLTTFKWRSSTYATKYHLQVATDSVFSAVVRDTTVADTIFTLSTPLAMNTLYYWHVSAINTGGESLWSSVAYFMTGTSLAVRETDRIPEEFTLLQNYPNPFNPSTVISYRLSAYSSVKLTVYDVLGREIKTLVDVPQNAGEYSVVWSATDEKNMPVSSGIYFCRLETDHGILQKKMILIK